MGPNPTEPASPNNYFRDSLPTQSRRYDIVTETLSSPSKEATPSSFCSLKASEKKNEGASNVPRATTTAILEQRIVVAAEETQVSLQQPPLPSSSSPVPSYGALDLFLHSIGANETRRQYRNKIGTFLDFVGLQGTLEQKAELFVRYARDDAKKNSSHNNSGGTNNNNHHQWAFAWVVKFILYHKARYERKEITGGTLRNYYKPLRVFCEANDIAIGWLKITRGLPKPRKFAQDRAPTNDEIRKVMTYPDRRIKPIVLVMSSSGIRVGAWDYLRWGHIEPIFRDRGGKVAVVVAAKMRVYAGEAEEYNTFITPEAYAAVKEWMDFRAEYGEKITANSWVMRDMFTTATLTWESNRGMARVPVQLKSSGIRTMLKRAWISQGLMKDKNSAIYEFKSSHGFRKRFKTQCELAGVKPLNVECMLGHDTGIAGSSYYRPNDIELSNDYLKAVDVLTITEEQRLQCEVAKLSQKLESDKAVTARLEEDDLKIERLQRKQEEYESLLQTLIDSGQLRPTAIGRSN